MADYYKESKQPHLEEYGIDFFSQQVQEQVVMASAHVHPAIEFIYISKGVFEIGIDNEHYTAREGDLLLFRSNAIHTTRHISNGADEYYVLKINPSLLFHIFPSSDNVGCIIPFIHKSSGDISYFPAEKLPGDVCDALKSMVEEYERSDRFFFASERALAARFIISLLRHTISPNISADNGEISEKSVELIHQSVKYINENYASDITPDDCAASIHLSYSYFAKLFRAVMGKTFKEYLTGVRIAKAHSILISTDLSITDVATSCGYSNLSYFISEYKKVYGKTPRDTRKELSGK